MIKSRYIEDPSKEPDKYEIEYKRHSYPSCDCRIFQVELTVKQQTGDQRNLAIRLGNETLTFSSQLAETEAANRLRALIQQITICVPNSWYDQSGICDGRTQDLKIRFIGQLRG